MDTKIVFFDIDGTIYSYEKGIPKDTAKAIELLKDPAYSITWVGYEVGFNDSTHFSRTFKKIVGISPRTYRAIKNSES